MLKCTRPRASTRRSLRARATTALALLGAVAALPLSAMGQGTLARSADLFAEPGQKVLATVRKGAVVVTGAANGRFVQVTVEGWVAAPFLGLSSDSTRLAVKPGAPVRLLLDAAPRSTIVADLRAGMELDEIDRKGAWVRVRRAGWVVATSVDTAARVAAAPAPDSATVVTPPPAQPAPVPASAAPASLDTSRDGVLLTPIAETGLAASPEGARVGTLLPGARATVTGRDRGWVRVRVEGWAREGDFSVADSALQGALSAADLRADPDGTEGRIVHWDVEVLAHQVADPLRKGLANREPYLLAQGPANEGALLYLAIPPALAATAAQIPDLARTTITARVRTGRSEPVGVPVLELITIVRR